jgi:hypothetical protein
MNPTCASISFSPTTCKAALYVAATKKTRPNPDGEEVIEAALGIADQAAAKKTRSNPEDKDEAEAALAEDSLAPKGKSVAVTAPEDTTKTTEPVAKAPTAAVAVKPIKITRTSQFSGRGKQPQRSQWYDVHFERVHKGWADGLRCLHCSMRLSDPGRIPNETAVKHLKWAHKINPPEVVALDV